MTLRFTGREDIETSLEEVVCRLLFGRVTDEEEDDLDIRRTSLRKALREG